MTGSLPPAGWYPDPSNDQQLRWWTGERWTGAARPVEVKEADPTAPLAAPEAATPTQHAGTDAAPTDRSDVPDDAAPDTTHEVPLVAAHEHQGPGEPAAWAGGGGSSWADHDATGDGPERGGGIAGWPRERRIALGAIAGLLLASVALWLIAVVIQGRGADTEVAVGDDSTTDADAADDAGSATNEPTGEGRTDTGAAAEEESGDDGELRTVDFDGVCSVEIAAADAADGASLRPWQFDECTFAPVNLDAGDGRWIVVIASIDGELSESEAMERAERYDTEYGLLWSTHYPSLNPGWWVVFDGPFAAEDDASRAADAAGGGSYPRLLSDDEGDRYCIAEDGC